MERHDIEALQAVHGFPAVTILLPTEQGWPGVRQNPVRVKNLVREAERRLRSECSARIWTPLIERMNDLADQIDYEHVDAGLALFVSKDVARVATFPFPVQQRVIIDETFATRDLVAAANRSPRYWVLALSEQPTRLFAGVRDHLHEVHAYGFPMTYDGPGPDGDRPLAGGRGEDSAAYRDAFRQQFFRTVDTALGDALAAESVSVILMGVEKYLAFFQEVSRHTDRVVATIAGNYDQTLPAEIAERTWPAMQGYLKEQQAGALVALATAVDGQMYVSGIEEIWRLAQEGRGSTLLVEEGYRYPARQDPTGLQLHAADNPLVPGTIEDAVDEVIETAIAKGGDVVFVPDGALHDHQRIALILRY